eukprot:tig00000194_g14796.t1
MDNLSSSVFADVMFMASPQERARRLAAVKAAHSSAEALLRVLSCDDAQRIADVCSWRRLGVADPITGVQSVREPSVAICMLPEYGGWKALRERFIELDGPPNLRCPPRPLQLPVNSASISWREAIRVCDLGIMHLMILGGGARVWRLLLSDAPLLDAICAAASASAATAGAELLAMQAMLLAADALEKSREVRDELGRRELWRPAVEWLRRAGPALEDPMALGTRNSLLSVPVVALDLAHSSASATRCLLLPNQVTEQTARAAGGVSPFDEDDEQEPAYPGTLARCRGVVTGALGSGIVPAAERLLSVLVPRRDSARRGPVSDMLWANVEPARVSAFFSQLLAFFGFSLRWDKPAASAAIRARPGFINLLHRLKSDPVPPSFFSFLSPSLPPPPSGYPSSPRASAPPFLPSSSPLPPAI